MLVVLLIKFVIRILDNVGAEVTIFWDVIVISKFNIRQSFVKSQALRAYVPPHVQLPLLPHGVSFSTQSFLKDFVFACLELMLDLNWLL